MKKLTQRQIDDAAAKLDTNGLRPGARVFDVTQAPYDDDDEWMKAPLTADEQEAVDAADDE